ncbi:MAG TPA: hypothetical protein VFL54_04535 [Gammaproteobacteria bacterium]|nr:hypothetical protein [Gammaproteobacteria bacterium]
MILVGSYHNRVSPRPKHKAAEKDEKTGDLFEKEPEPSEPPRWPGDSEAQRAGFESVDEVKKLAMHREAIANDMAKEHLRRERHADAAWRRGKYTRAKFRIHHIADKYGMNPHSHVLDVIAGHVSLGTMGANADEADAARSVALKTTNALLARAGLDPANLPVERPEEPEDSLFARHG